MVPLWTINLYENQENILYLFMPIIYAVQVSLNAEGYANVMQDAPPPLFFIPDFISSFLCNSLMSFPAQASLQCNWTDRKHYKAFSLGCMS